MPKSAALRLCEIVWEHNREATGFSWTRLNSSMREAVNLAINAGLRFGLKDFCYMAEHWRIEYWAGMWGNNNLGEGWYSQAVEMDNLSACLAFEKWKRRRPCIFEGKRLCINSKFQWEGLPVKVASFRADGSMVVSCYRKPDGSLSERPTRLFYITVEMLKAQERLNKAAIEKAKADEHKSEAAL